MSAAAQDLCYQQCIRENENETMQKNRENMFYIISYNYLYTYATSKFCLLKQNKAFALEKERIYLGNNYS